MKMQSLIAPRSCFSSVKAFLVLLESGADLARDTFQRAVRRRSCGLQRTYRRTAWHHTEEVFGQHRSLRRRRAHLIQLQMGQV